MADVLDVAKQAKSKIDAPLVLFSYVNPVLQYGFERLITSAEENGIAGLLLTDLPADNAARLAAFARPYGVDLITLAAPTCSDERLKTICAHASGFIYAVSRTGVTGTQQQLSADARALVERVRRCTSLPVALGFGVSNREQAKEVLTFADAVIVGSAIVQLIETNSGRPDDPGPPANAIAFAGVEDLAASIEALARELAGNGHADCTPTNARSALAGDPSADAAAISLAVKETH